MSRPHVATASELSTLRDLEFVARTTVEGLRHGLHRSPFHGYSAEFSQYRHYRPGDDLRYVDWKRFARTDRLYTRQFRDTTNLQALFVLDVSRSMDYQEKFVLARRAAAALGTLIIDQGDGAGLLAVGETVRYLPARSGHRHLTAFLKALSTLSPTASTPPTTALARAASLLTRRGLVLVLSDFYDAEAIPVLRRLGRMGHEIVAIQTLAADEMDLPPVGAAEFVDLETARTVAVQAQAAAASYRSRVQSWLRATETEVRREGLDYLRLITGEDLEAALRRFLIARAGGA